MNAWLTQALQIVGLAAGTGLAGGLLITWVWRRWG